MVRISLTVIVFIFSGLLRADNHSIQEVIRETVELKRNDKYLALCNGKGPISTQTSKITPLEVETRAAYDLLRIKCANCHYPGSTSGAKTFQDVLDVEDLLNHGIVKVKDVASSTLIERIEDGSMPQGGKELSQVEKKILKTWIEKGAKSFSTSTVDIPEVGFISIDDLEACMVKDLRNVKEEDQAFVRYLNLGNLYNSNKRDKLEITRLAVNKLLNSLSWKKGVKNPISVDETGTLLRLDLRDYKWTPEMWEEIAKLNPYRQPIESTKDRGLTDKMLTNTPLLRADWLVDTASKPPLYHTLLYDLQNLPVVVGKTNAKKSLEKLLLVDGAKNERTGDLNTAGFRQSNVTKSNRIIKRHDTPYGAYWESEDFKTRAGEQNIFEHPLDAKKDGGEFIYSLPNGLHGYLVTDKNGNRLDGAPTEVVIDPLRINTDGVVLPGVSCMSCHLKGIKKHDDEISNYFENLETLFKDKGNNPQLEKLITDVKRVYKGNKNLNEEYSLDESAYTDAIKKTGNSIENPDPVQLTAAQFEAPLDIKSMAAELGHTPEEVEIAINSNLNLKQKLVFGNQRTVDREAFNANFSLLKNALKRDVESLGNPGTVSQDPSLDAHFEFVLIKPGTFLMGSPLNEIGRLSHETQHSVTLTKPFEIQSTEVTNGLWKKIMNTNPALDIVNLGRNFAGENQPVVNVSWNDAQEFIRKLNELPEIRRSSFEYRLPSEAEWEYAARGGNQISPAEMQAAYSFGSDASKFANFGWSFKNSDRQTHAVADSSKKTNPAKLHDMIGNVWEWVEDAYQDNLGSISATDPHVNSGLGQRDNPKRVIRGGSWLSTEEALRSATRFRYPAGFRNVDVGFRLVRTPR